MNTLPHDPSTKTSHAPIESSGPNTPARPNSVLARVMALSQPDTSVLQPFDQPLYSAEHLQRLHTSTIGKAFHIVNSEGELLRRGVVAEDYPTHLIVYFCDPLTGIPCKKASVPKANTAKWRWFAGIEESNAAYEKHFKITINDHAPMPRLVFEAHDLIQVV